LLEALEKLSRKRVSADDASYSNRYICPECRMPVDLRAGSVRSAYFAHAHGVSNEDCRLYAAGQMSSGGYAAHTQGDEEERLLRLFLKIGRVRGQYTWGLELSVPTARQSFGSVTVEVGGLVSQINLLGNTAGHRIVTAEPQSSPYRITEVTPKFGPLWSVHRECLGLSSEFATVFGDVAVLGGKTYPLAKQLRAERSFAFIWSATIIPEFPDELNVKPIAGRPGWAAAIVDIPHSPSQQCQDWLTNFSSLRFASTTPAILSVWPPLVRAVTSRLLEAQPNRALMLFVEHPSNDAVPPLFARCSTSERVAQAELCTAPFYLLAPERAPSVHLACRKTEGLEIDIDFALNEVDLRPAISNVVMLRGISNDGFKSSVALHTEEVIGWLNSVRCGEIKLIGVELPIGLTGFVSATRDFVVIERVELGGFATRIEIDSHISLDAEKASKLATWLLDRHIDVVIDFGGFGRAVVLGVPQPVLINNLRADTIRKVEHFFRRFPDCTRLRPNWRSLSISELYVELKKVKPRKESIISHRLLVSQLTRNHDLTVKNK